MSCFQGFTRINVIKTVKINIKERKEVPILEYRTDLAVESRQQITDGAGGAEPDGIVTQHSSYDGGIDVTCIDITNETGAALMNKPCGRYVTIEADGIIDGNDDMKPYLEYALAEELGRMVKFHSRLRVLVAGLGNRMVTPDSLGPLTVSKIKATRHLFIMFEADSDDEMSCVSCIEPGVTGVTGMETADIVRKASELVQPDVIIAVDSLAARNIGRMSTTIQITDTGISPGGGMGNKRTGINSGTTGAKVIAIGVPTVIGASTIILDAVGGAEGYDEKTVSRIRESDSQMIVTSTDIDMIIKEFSDIIAGGINKTLHPGIYS